MDDKDFLELFKRVAKIVRPAHQGDFNVRDMDEDLKETGLDSLDALMAGIYLSEVYGVAEELCKEWHPKTPREYKDFLETHKTITPTSVDEAIASVTW